jgi:hypothetical protein
LYNKKLCINLYVSLIDGQNKNNSTKISNDASPQHRSVLVLNFEGHTHPQSTKKLNPLAWGAVAPPFNALAWSARPHVGR